MNSQHVTLLILLDLSAADLNNKAIFLNKLVHNVRSIKCIGLFAIISLMMADSRKRLVKRF